MGSAWVGAQSSNEKNSPKETSPKKSIVGESSEITIAVVVMTEITAQPASRHSISLLAITRTLGHQGPGGISPAGSPVAAARVSRFHLYACYLEPRR